MSSPSYFEVDLDRLNEIAESTAESYRNAEPFPHTMIENFVKPEVLEDVLAECVRGAGRWHHMNDEFQNKFATSRTSEMGPKTRNLIQFLNGQEMLEFLEKLTGISGLIPDPQLAGGGLHELRSGGFLRVHADFNYQRHLKLDRRINLLLYLNKDWDESYGGNLELWDKGTTRCVKKYAPVFNRCVIFNTTDTSFHGNPEPVKAPNGRTRRSIALYYYSNGRPESEVSPQHMTIFRKRPHERTAVDAGKSILRQITPPIIFDGLRRLRGGAD